MADTVISFTAFGGVPYQGRSPELRASDSMPGKALLWCSDYRLDKPGFDWRGRAGAFLRPENLRRAAARAPEPVFRFEAWGRTYDVRNPRIEDDGRLRVADYRLADSQIDSSWVGLVGWWPIGDISGLRLAP